MNKYPSLLRPEVLAPAGTWDALEAVVGAGADAVYLGGKRFNMRLHRNTHNFSDEELVRARAYTLERGVKLYITMNNLMTAGELEEALPYLDFLEELKPDALIVQDMGLLSLLHRRKTAVPLHASVMMNTHSREMIYWLKEMGVSRVIASREMSLGEIKALKTQVEMEFEYFIHGDMCFSQSGQCLQSGILFGASSNRGRCMKPCRWPYRLNESEEPQYHLAVKDMCMYPHIPDLILAGVCSFKIEGRMRPAGFLAPIVRAYRQAIDRYMEDPLGYDMDQQAYQEMEENRVRDFSPAYAFGNPGRDFIGYDGKKEPMVFSVAVEEPVLDREGISAVSSRLGEGLEPFKEGHPPRLAVTVDSMAAFNRILESGQAHILYVGGDMFRPLPPWGRAEMQEAIAKGREKGIEVMLRTMPVSMEREMEDIRMLARLAEELQPDGVLIGNPGQLHLFQKETSLNLVADYSMNIMNGEATRELEEWGISRAAVSLECSGEQLQQLARNTSLPLEMIAHGPIPAMISDHKLAWAANPEPFLVDEKGHIHQVRVDQYGRNTLFFHHYLGLLPFMKEFMALGVEAVRIDGRGYAPEVLDRIVTLYRRNLDRLEKEGMDYIFDGSDWDELRTIHPVPLWAGSLSR